MGDRDQKPAQENGIGAPGSSRKELSGSLSVLQGKQKHTWGAKAQAKGGVRGCIPLCYCSVNHNNVIMLILNVFGFVFVF